jgi:signal transduction histidine kinase
MLAVGFNKNKLARQFKKYHFEFKHIIILFSILFIFQIVTSFFHKYSVRQILFRTQEWYQRDSAERLANLIATSLELLLETNLPRAIENEEYEARVIRSINIILIQQVLQKNVNKVCLLVEREKKITAIDKGQSLFAFLQGHDYSNIQNNQEYATAIQTYSTIKNRLSREEQIISILEGEQTFHVFVPFVPTGEFLGAIYVNISPNFGFITDKIIVNFNETNAIFIALIVFGLLAIFYITSYTIKERDEVQEALFKERQVQMQNEIEHNKESMFTNRIYHTNHKAEKIMGFIKEDLSRLSKENIDEIKYRVNKYSNFVSRVIYDMKWYDPPVQTIRNPVFNTDLNRIIEFLIEHVFLRVVKHSKKCTFTLDLDEKVPPVHINEFVVWEILEPLIQNSIDHGGDKNLIIQIITRFDQSVNQSQIIIRDNGSGISTDLLQNNRAGYQKLFEENISTKEGRNRGYGCYIAYELAKNRCGWELYAESLGENIGSQFVITLPTV